MRKILHIKEPALSMNENVKVKLKKDDNTIAEQVVVAQLLRRAQTMPREIPKVVGLHQGASPGSGL